MSISQFKNRVKVIAVARIGAEFRKANIVGRIIKRAQDKGHVASGKLTSPKKSRSITPFSDDRWLIRKDAVVVSAVELPSKEYAVSNIRVRVRYGLNFKYHNLSTAFTKKNRWFPSTNAIEDWIRKKQKQGQFTDVKEKQIKSVAFAISRKISKKGIKATTFANVFFNKQNGVEATLNRGINKTVERVSDLYGSSVDRAVGKMFQL